jgi:nucleoside phosphorylase
MRCVLVAFRKEASCFLARAGQVRTEVSRGGEKACHGRAEAPRGTRGGPKIYTLDYAGHETRVVKTGMGPSEPAPSLLRGCDLVVSTGFCGALSTELRPGDLVVSSGVTLVDAGQLNLILHDRRAAARERYPVAGIDNGGEVCQKLNCLQKKGIRVHSGRTVTSRRVVKTPQEKLSLGGYFQAIAVDMEDFYRLSAARSAGRSCLCVRAVLDRAADAVPGFRSGLRLPAHLAQLRRNMDLACRSIDEALSVLLQ